MFSFLPRMIHLGPLPLHLYGITLVLGVVAGCLIAMQAAREKSINPNDVVDFAIYALIAGIVFARLVFAVQNLPAFIASPLSVFALQEGGLSFHGGLLGGLLAGIWFVKRKQLSFWSFADMIAPALAIGEAVGRIGCDLYGKPVSGGMLPIIINGIKYHNVPLYTGVSSLGIFFILWFSRKKVKPGSLFPLYIMLYSIARFLIEFTRQSTMIGALSIGQIASLALFAICGLVLIIMNKNSKTATIRMGGFS
jgi:prolipoprotein diacylglyceryl transferase